MMGYSVTSTPGLVVIDHDGLFSYIDAGIGGSFHDVRCLRGSHIFANWRQYFRNNNLDVVQEYLLGDPGYIGVEMFILRRVDGRELMEDGNPVADAFNRRHAARRIQVEWGIGGMKSRFQKFLTVSTSRRSGFRSYFEDCCRLTNFLHRRRMDFAITDDGEYEQMPQQELGFAAEWDD
jgi:hypothetical protein